MIPPRLRMKTPPLVRGAVCLYPWDPALARLFTVPSNYEDQEPMRLWTKIVRDGVEYIGLPWHCCPQGDEIDERVAGDPVFLKSLIQPRSDEQARVMAEFKQQLLAGHNFVLRAPTGEGKTYMGLDAIAALGRTTLVVPPKDDLIDQWIEAAGPVLGLGKAQIGRIQGDTCDIIGKPIVIASLASVSKPDRYPPHVYRAFGLIMFDEVHRLGADQMGEVARLFYAQQRVGLSATPKRKDGKDLVIDAHVGPVTIVMKQTTLPPKVLRFESKWRCPRNKNGDQIPHKPGRTAHISKFLFNHARRNRLICHFAREAYAAGRTCILFSGHTEHLELLEILVQKPRALGGAGIPAHDIGRYYGTKTKGDLLKAQGKKRFVLATPQKAGEGTNFPEWDTAILVDPKSDVEQIVGRVLRSMPGKKQPVVFDILDSDSRVYAGYASKRKQFYLSKGAEIIDVDLPDEELGIGGTHGV